MKIYNTNIFNICTIAVAIGLVAGCSGKTIKEPSKPGWVLRGIGALEEKLEKVLYGVGSVWRVKNPTLMRSTADNRAPRGDRQGF